MTETVFPDPIVTDTSSQLLPRAEEARRARLGPESSIAALVPHYQCEQWLGDCLESLLRQTRPLDAIVVIDDASGQPPTDVVERYPEVTLLSSGTNVGPYALMQQVIADTGYDGYLFQDADDWSAPDRLETLLAEAERTGAELVGCQEVLIDCEATTAQLVHYPLDVNQAVIDRPGSFALAHHTAVVARDLMARVGGFATGLRIGADSELLPRVARAGVVRNVARCCYFRRRRGGSLTTADETGMESALRARVAALLGAQREEDRARAARGEATALRPLAVASPVVLTHLLGPTLRSWEAFETSSITDQPLTGAGLGGRS